VKRLYLFHHDPDRSDEEIDKIVDLSQLMAKDLGSHLLIEGAMEGISLLI